MCEKETKTKAYSKEGLSLQARKDKDSRDTVKQPLYAWLDEMIERLEEQQTELEGELEGFSAGGKKKKCVIFVIAASQRLVQFLCTASLCFAS